MRRWGVRPHPTHAPLLPARRGASSEQAHPRDSVPFFPSSFQHLRPSPAAVMFSAGSCAGHAARVLSWKSPRDRAFQGGCPALSSSLSPSAGRSLPSTLGHLTGSQVRSHIKGRPSEPGSMDRAATSRGWCLCPPVGAGAQQARSPWCAPMPHVRAGAWLAKPPWWVPRPHVRWGTAG